MLGDWLSSNYAALLAYVFMMTFLLSNVIFEKKVTRNFIIAINMVLLLTIVDTVEGMMAALDHPTMLRVWASAIGYTARPLSIMCILIIHVNGNKWKRYWMILPVFLNTVISFSALFTDIAFSYSPTNEFIRGPLGISTYIASAIYLIILIVDTIKKCVTVRGYSEALVVFNIVIITVVSVVLEVLYPESGCLNTSIGFSIIFYFLYYYAQTYKMDPLTRTLSRRAFYLDADKHKRNLKAVISLDLNDLKDLNDIYGHSEGDKALQTTALCVEQNLPMCCKFYRTGGDEFMILCFKCSEETIETLVANIKKDMEATPYSCAIGIAYIKKDENFYALCDRADAEMYKDKQMMKGEKQ